MQAGKPDRGRLGDEFNALLTEDRVQEAAPRLKALGEPVSVEVDGASERGGMEVASIRFRFKKATLRALLYRTTDGKIHEFLIRRS
jgi:hypothetical protein